jgi:hypothetical protein
MFKKKKTVNFDKEIKNVENKGLPTIIKRMTVMGVIFFGILGFTIYKLTNFKKEIIFLYKNFEEEFFALLFLLFLLVVYIANLLMEIFYIDEETEEDKRKKIQNREYDGEEIIDLFTKNLLFPDDEKQRKIYKEIFYEFYGKDFEMFKNWLKSRKMTPKELYVKLLKNEKVQKEIEKELLKENIKAIGEIVSKENIEKLKEQKLENEINDYFKN